MRKVPMFERVLHALATMIYTSSVFYIAPSLMYSLYMTTLNTKRYTLQH